MADPTATQHSWPSLLWLGSISCFLAFSSECGLHVGHVKVCGRVQALERRKEEEEAEVSDAAVALRFHQTSRAAGHDVASARLPQSKGTSSFALILTPTV